MTFNEYIGSFSKVAVSERGQEINRIAEACRVKPLSVYNWLSGRNAPLPVYRKIIAQTIGKPESELFPEGDER